MNKEQYRVPEYKKYKWLNDLIINFDYGGNKKINDKFKEDVETLIHDGANPKLAETKITSKAFRIAEESIKNMKLELLLEKLINYLSQSREMNKEEIDDMFNHTHSLFLVGQVMRKNNPNDILWDACLIGDVRNYESSQKRSCDVVLEALRETI